MELKDKQELARLMFELAKEQHAKCGGTCGVSTHQLRKQLEVIGLEFTKEQIEGVLW
jgi:hypothetical protein